LAAAAAAVTATSAASTYANENRNRDIFARAAAAGVWRGFNKNRTGTKNRPDRRRGTGGVGEGLLYARGTNSSGRHGRPFISLAYSVVRLFPDGSSSIGRGWVRGARARANDGKHDDVSRVSKTV